MIQVKVLKNYWRLPMTTTCMYTIIIIRKMNCHHALPCKTGDSLNRQWIAGAIKFGAIKNLMYAHIRLGSPNDILRHPCSNFMYNYIYDL